MITAAYILTGAFIALVLFMILLELRARRRRQLTTPHTLFTEPRECLAHSHWKRLLERRKARERANTLPPFEHADPKEFISAHRRKQP
jgi:hypothetical protein